MQVKRDFDRIYAEEPDPWAIGTAADPRYDRYRELVLARVRGGGLLDIGCGLGAFLARFRGDFDTLTGVETAAEAVRRAEEAHPDIEFVHAAAENLAATELDGRRFDAIVLSDVVYYLAQRDRARLVEWVARHLAPGGWALIAAWCPGGRYLEPAELRALVRSSLRIGDDLVLPSEHVALMCEPKRRLLALAFEHGPGADCERDVLAPTEALLAASGSFPVTLLAENDGRDVLATDAPGTAERLEEQRRAAIERGHDVRFRRWSDDRAELAARMSIVELPLDGARAERLPEQAAAALRSRAERSPEAIRRRRRIAQALTRIGLGRFIPSDPPPHGAAHDYIVATGRIDRRLRVDALVEATATLRRLGFELVTLTELETVARAELGERGGSRDHGC